MDKENNARLSPYSFKPNTPSSWQGSHAYAHQANRYPSNLQFAGSQFLESRTQYLWVHCFHALEMLCDTAL